MAKKLIIAITGNKGSGKNTFGDLLQQDFSIMGKSVAQFAFADKLKEHSADLLGISIDEIEVLKRTGVRVAGNVTIRSFLIKLSFMLKEINGNDYFAKIVCNKIEQSNKDVCIVTDVRFKIEEIMLKELAISDDYDVVFVKLREKDNNESELEVDKIDVDYVYTNDKSDIKNIKVIARDFINKLGYHI